MPAVPQAQMESGPTILLCPHFVCLDVAGVAARVMPLSTDVRAAKEQGVRRLLRYGRERFGPVRLFTREDGIKPIIRALRDGLPYFMLPDMDFGEKDAAFVPFFGIPAATLTATAAPGRRHRRQGHPGGRHLPAQLPGLPGRVLSGLGQLPGRRHDRRHAPHECLHRRARARSTRPNISGPTSASRPGRPANLRSTIKRI